MFVLGIDLGGSNLRLGLVTESGDLEEHSSKSIGRDLTGDQIVEEILGEAGRVCGSKQISAVGVGLAATVLSGGALERGLTTLPHLGGFPLAQRLAQAFGRPCLIDNDANTALRAEAHFGAAHGCKDVMLLTLGTGIGSSLLLEGRLRQGFHSSGVEAGLTLVPDPRSSLYVPIEGLAAPRAIMERLGRPHEHLLEHYRSGDRLAQRLLEEMFEYIGLLVTNAHLLLDLQLVLLGGGLVEAGDLVSEGVEKAFRRLCPEGYQFGLRISRGRLPPAAAGVIGAASLWLEHEGVLPTL